MPTYLNTEDQPVTVQLFDVVVEADGTSPPIIRAVPLQPITIDPGETADLPQAVDGNVLQLVPDAPPPPQADLSAAVPKGLTL